MLGGHLVAHTLKKLGPGVIFSVSGNQILPVYDGAAEFGLKILHTRHESATAYAALAWSEMTGQPGVILVSAGPAFLASLVGVATARAFELPLLFLSGASANTNAGTGLFQEQDQRSVAVTVAKASFDLRSVEDIPVVLAEAWRITLDGIPGPVHVKLPADVMVAQAMRIDEVSPARPADSITEEAQLHLRHVAETLIQAERPLIIARLAATRGTAGTALKKLARNVGAPVLVNEAPRGLGDLRYSHLVRYYKDADCLLAIAPSDSSVTFYEPASFAARGRFLLIDSPEDPLPRRRADVRVQVPPAPALAFLAEATTLQEKKPAAWMGQWQFPAPDFALFKTTSEGLHPMHVAERLRRFLEPDDVLIVDGGEFGQWIRYGLCDVPNRFLWNSKFGGIGGAIPMAMGVRAAAGPGRVIALLGDGGAGYHLSEFETAARYGLNFVAIIGNDSRWGIEWLMQTNRYGRTYETNLSHARYDRAAEALGGCGHYVTTVEELDQALHQALQNNSATCINVRTLLARSPAEPV